MIYKSTHLLVLTHMLISFGGFCLHMGLHPPARSLYFWWAAPLSGVSLILLPPLFLRVSTVGMAVLMNAFAVTAGVVGMGYLTIVHPPEPLTLKNMLAQSTLAPMAILLTKLPLAHLIHREMRREVT